MAKGKAKFKFNGEYGALCCSHCGNIIKESKYFSEEEWEACRGKIKLKPQFCDICNERKEQLGKNT